MKKIIIVAALFICSSFQTKPEPKIYTISLSENELNITIAALADRPYKETAGLINKIIEQAQEQNKPKEKK